MKSIRNKTTAPLRVPLPRGKTLHLGPRKTGQIAVHDADHPPLQKLVEDGKVEIFDEAAHDSGAAGGEPSVQAQTHGKGPNTMVQKAGNR